MPWEISIDVLRALAAACVARAVAHASDVAQIVRASDVLKTSAALASTRLALAFASNVARMLFVMCDAWLFATYVVRGDRSPEEAADARRALETRGASGTRYEVVGRARGGRGANEGGVTDVRLEAFDSGRSRVVWTRGTMVVVSRRAGGRRDGSSDGANGRAGSWYDAFALGVGDRSSASGGGEVSGSGAERFTVRVLRLFRSERATRECLLELLRAGASARERERASQAEFTRVYLPRTVMEYSPTGASSSHGDGHRARFRGEQCWVDLPGGKPTRPLDTIVLPPGAREFIEDDVREFLRSERWYVDRGLPYRRGYILHGLPGTGKSSLVFSLAGHFNLPLYVVRLSDERLCDEGLHRLFQTTEKRSIILLDDVDAPGANRSVFRELRAGETTGNLSVQATLSLFDGATSIDGRLIFMTCRDKSALNQTLIRPGRFDVSLHFDLPGKEQIESYFNHFFSDVPKIDVAAAAKEFAELAVSTEDVQPASMAALQSMFLSHKSAPLDALEAMRARASRRSPSAPRAASGDAAKSVVSGDARDPIIAPAA